MISTSGNEKEGIWDKSLWSTDLVKGCKRDLNTDP